MPMLEKNLQSTLDDTHYSTEWRGLYKAIASYKNKKAVALLKIPFTQVPYQGIKTYHMDFVYEAIQAFQDPIYDELYWKIWEEESQISPQIYEYLLSVNPSKAYEWTKKQLLKNYTVKASNFIPTTKDVEFSEDVEESMLNVLIANDKALTNSVILEQIERADVHSLPLYTSKVNKEQVFVEPLFKTLENAWNAHIYLDLVKTLITYEDETINQRILEVRKINKHLTEDWGGKALDELLEENNIR